MDLFLKNYKCYIVLNQACGKIMKCCTIRKEHLNSFYSFYQDFFLRSIFTHVIVSHNFNFKNYIYEKNCTYFTQKPNVERVCRPAINLAVELA